MRKIKHVLVVDNDSVCRYIAGYALEQADIAQKITYCSNGEDALAYIKETCLTAPFDARRKCPDLILLDITMPILDGYEFLKELSTIEDLKHEDIAVILLSSSSYEREEIDVKKFNVLGYIEKPIRPEKLLEVVSPKYKTLQD